MTLEQRLRQRALIRPAAPADVPVLGDDFIDSLDADMRRLRVNDPLHRWLDPTTTVAF